jgi:hypothetical protein
VYGEGGGVGMGGGVGGGLGFGGAGVGPGVGGAGIGVGGVGFLNGTNAVFGLNTIGSRGDRLSRASFVIQMHPLAPLLYV